MSAAGDRQTLQGDSADAAADLWLRAYAAGLYYVGISTASIRVTTLFKLDSLGFVALVVLALCLWGLLFALTHRIAESSGHARLAWVATTGVIAALSIAVSLALAPLSEAACASWLITALGFLGLGVALRRLLRAVRDRGLPETRSTVLLFGASVGVVILSVALWIGAGWRWTLLYALYAGMEATVALVVASSVVWAWRRQEASRMQPSMASESAPRSHSR